MLIQRLRSVRMKAVFGIGLALILLAPTGTYWITGSQALAGLAFLVASTFTVLTRFNEVVEFSLGPLKTKMRETIAEAAATVEQIRNVGISVSRVVLTDLTGC